MSHCQARGRKVEIDAPEHHTSHENGSASNAYVQDQLKETLAGQNRQAKPGRLPFRDRLEAAFGMDLGDVDAWFGASDALGGAKAQAVTDGEGVAFAEDAPDFETVAHEVGHLRQKQNGAAGSGIDRGGAAEDEAEGAAKAAARGEEVTLDAPLQAALHRQVENPVPFDHTKPTDTIETVYRDVEIEDGYSSSPNGVPKNHFLPDGASVSLEVNVLATKDQPLELSGCPDEAQLFEVVSEGDQSTGAGEPVTTRFGSIANPDVLVKREDEALYINDGPSLDDISQGAVGDCYFLAAVSNIVAQDPEKIKASVQNAGATVTVNLHQYDGAAWQPVTITTDRTALHKLDTADPTTTYAGLIAAGARVGDEPVGSEWYVTVDAEVMTIVRQDIYEMALWAPLLEKAYARLAERTNQYGGGPARDIPTGGTSGYERIDGGLEDQVYPLFYGGDMVENRREESRYAPDQDLVPLNEEVVSNLLRVMGEGVSKNERFMLTASLGPPSAVSRLIELLGHIAGLREAQQYPSLLRIMGDVRVLAQGYQTAVAGGLDTTLPLERLAKACERQAKPGAWPLLQNPKSDKIWTDLNEHLNIVAHLGVDSSNGQRGIYAGHAYPVLGAHFKDANGQDLSVTQSNLSAELSKISGQHSTVDLQNPHHTNEPNLPTSQTDANSEDGLFSLSLDQYLRSFADQRIGEMKDTP